MATNTTITTTANTVANQPNAPVSFGVNQGQQGQQEPQGQQQVQATTQNTQAQQSQQSQQQDPGKTEQPFKSFATQKDYDDEIAKLRGSLEYKVESNILKTLGLKPEEKDKLEKFKQAYEASLTKEEKQQQELAKLAELQQANAEKDAIISALTKLSGKTSDDVIKLVKMAKGLVSDEVTIDQAIDEVMELSNSAKAPKPPIVSQPINQGSEGSMEINPFKEGKDFSLTEQGKLFKQDPNKARMLAKQANYPINF